MKTYPKNFAALLMLCAWPLLSQTAQPAYPDPSAYSLGVDRGAAGLRQSLQKLRTRASLMMIVAHPDDEDGGMLARVSRGEGVQTTLFTLNRGEGGQNVMSGDFWDELGVLRTQELLAADRYYGVDQRFGRFADFGFSKTLDESLKMWGHDRVLYDVVRQVRITRPLVVTSVFTGYVSDGHGHHQVAGEMAQLAYKLAGDPKVFPDQIASGLQPWSPLKVYERVPFSRVTEKGVFDYATGKWEPLHFTNFVTGDVMRAVPSTTVEVHEGDYSPLLGESYIAIARTGLAQQKSQNDGVGVPPAGAFDAPYHLYASRVSATLPAQEKNFFDGIDTSLAAIADVVPSTERGPWRARLQSLQSTVELATKLFAASDPSRSAPALAQGLDQTRALLAEMEHSSLQAEAKSAMLHDLHIKQDQFNTALAQSLGLSLVASVDPITGPVQPGPFGNMRSNTQTYQAAVPGQKVSVNLRFVNQGAQPLQVTAATLVPSAGDWHVTVEHGSGALKAGDALETQASATVPTDASFTRPYFTRPTLEQPYYDVAPAEFLGLPTVPYPLTARVEYTFNDVRAQIDATVQTVQHVSGLGPQMQPLIVAPAISIQVEPAVGIAPLDGKTLSVTATVRSSVKGFAEGDLHLGLPQGWTATPAAAHFSTQRDGDARELRFTVTPATLTAQAYRIGAVATYDGKQYREGWRSIGYAGLRPYPIYRAAEYRVTGVDVKTAPGLHVGYVMGTGDDVPSSLEELGVHVTQLNAAELAGGTLDGYDAIVVGIRAYTNRADLRANNARLLDYVRRGGTVLVQYQAGDFDHNYGPYPIALGEAERVVEEDSRVTLLAPDDALLNWPNKITTADFDSWVEERGHGFAGAWAPQFNALTEMHDAGQDAQKGGLLYARAGKGTYIYMSFAFFRQLPEGVPGAFRIMANLISAGKNPNLR